MNKAVRNYSIVNQRLPVGRRIISVDANVVKQQLVAFAHSLYAVEHDLFEKRHQSSAIWAFRTKKKAWQMPFTYDYPRPAVSADVLVLDRDSNSILLIQRKKDPFALSWALPGGFMEMDESADVGAIRELKEETGLVINSVQQIGAYSSVDRDPRGRVVTIAFFATASESDYFAAADDAADARWFSINDLPDLAFDHAEIVSDGLQRFAS